MLAATLAETLKAQGVADLRAVLAAGTRLAAFVHAAVLWFDDPYVCFGDRLFLTLRDAVGELGSAVAWALAAAVPTNCFKRP